MHGAGGLSTGLSGASDDAAPDGPGISRSSAASCVDCNAIRTGDFAHVRRIDLWIVAGILAQFELDDFGALGDRDQGVVNEVATVRGVKPRRSADNPSRRHS